MLKMPKFPAAVAKASVFLFAVCVVQAQRADISVHFKKQHEDGSVDIAVNCTLTGLDTKVFNSYGPCSIRSHITGNMSHSLKLASSGGWTERYDRTSQKSCEHQVKLVATQNMAQVTENHFGSNDRIQKKAVPMLSSEQQLFCRRGFSYCTGEWGGFEFLSTSYCKTTVTNKEANSSLLLASDIREKFVRSAKVTTRSTAGINEGDLLKVPYDGNLILECEVTNLETLPGNRCQWLMVRNQQNATLRFGGQKNILVATSSGAKAQGSQVDHPSKRPYLCLLELRGINETMEGHWSCTPSAGQQDGFISPSTSVAIKVIDGCNAHRECPKINEVCLNATDKVPRRHCGNPCDQEKTKHLCGNHTNSLCEVEKNTPAGMVCPCQDKYGSDTGYPRNRTRCLRRCSTNGECLPVPGTICIRVRNDAGRCFPVCDEVAQPRCGAGASCHAHEVKPPTTLPADAPSSWTSRCECEEGKFQNYLLPNSSFQCELPIFDGLHLHINGERQGSCSISAYNGIAHCQINLTEGSMLNVTCEAPRVFPAATLELPFTTSGNSSVMKGVVRGQLGTWYRGELLAIMNITIPDHDNATFVCKLTSPASNATMIEMRLRVTPLADAVAADAVAADAVSGSSVALVAGISTAASVIIVVIALVAIGVIKMKHRQHRQPVSKGNDSMIQSESNRPPRGPLPPPSFYSVRFNASTKQQHCSNNQENSQHQTISSDDLPTHSSPKSSTTGPVTCSVVKESLTQPPSFREVAIVNMVTETQDDIIYADLDLCQSGATAPTPICKSSEPQRPLKQKVPEEETIYASIVGEIIQDDLQPEED